MASLILLSGCATRYDGAPDPCRPQSAATIVEWVDGDTVDVTTANGEERLRLLGIDTPEVDHSDPLNSECYGALAWNESQDLLPVGEDVQLTFDESCEGMFERTLAYIYRDSDGLFLNDHLIRQGFARVSSFDAYFTPSFEEAQEEAQLAQRGLWASCL